MSTVLRTYIQCDEEVEGSGLGEGGTGGAFLGSLWLGGSEQFVVLLEKKSSGLEIDFDFSM